MTMAVNSLITPLRSSSKRSLFRDNTSFRYFTRVEENDRFEECTPLSSNSDSSPEKSTPPKQKRMHKRIPFSLLITPNKIKTVIPETPTKNDDTDSIESSSPSLQLYPNLGTPTTPKPEFDGIPTEKFYAKYMRIPDFSLAFPPLTEEDKKRAQRKKAPKRKRIDLSQPGVWHNIKKPKIIKAKKKKSLKRKLSDMMSPLMKTTMMINTPPVTPEDELASPTKVPAEEPFESQPLQEDTPDLSKKFFKHSHTRAVFTLNKNVKINLTASGGKLTVKRSLGFTPQPHKKRRTMTKTPLEPIKLFEEQTEEPKIVAEGQIESLIDILDDKNQDGIVQIEEHIVNVISEEELLETIEKNENSNPVILTIAEQIDKDFSEFLETDSYNEAIDDISPPKIQDEIVNFDSNSNEKSLLTPNKHSLKTDDLTSPGQMVRDLTNSTSSLALASPDAENAKKYYPIFDKNHFDRTESTPTSSAKKKIAFHPSIINQGIIDAGQKKFGAISCSICGLLYEQANDQDEKIHKEYHEHRNVLRFKSWNKERVVVEIDLFKRIIVVYPNDPKAWINKCLEIMDQVDRELGFPLTKNRNLNAKKVYLYIIKDTVAGCIVAEPITQAFKLIPSNEGGLDTFSEEPAPAKCGISRIWTNSKFRRQGIAVQLLDAVRFDFMFGGILNKSDLAFSAPTNNGKELAKKYFSQNDFLIYV